MGKLTAKRLANIRSALLSKRDEYRKRANAIYKDVGRGVSPDSSERVVELGNSMVLDELEREAQGELQKIEVALKLIDAGEYGRCAGCEEDIDYERLLAYPLAVNCLSCAQYEEQYKLRH